MWVLQRHNDRAVICVKQTTHVLVVKDEEDASSVEKPVVAPSDIGADIVESVPKTMKVKAKRLMDHLKPISHGPNESI